MRSKIYNLPPTATVEFNFKGREESSARTVGSHWRKQIKYESRLFHDLRRSAPRDMIRAGVAQTIAMKITGHKTAKMFQRYNIADTDDLREALSKAALHRHAGREKVRSPTQRSLHDSRRLRAILPVAQLTDSI